MRHAQKNLALTPQMPLFLVDEVDRWLDSPLFNLCDLALRQIVCRESCPPTVEIANGRLNLVIVFDRDKRPRSTTRKIRWRLLHRLLSIQRND